MVKKVVLSEDTGEWEDWQRVLYTWRSHFHRVGLTPHCVATVCERDPVEILDEAFDSKEVRLSYCGYIKAPIMVLPLVPQTAFVEGVGVTKFEIPGSSYGSFDPVIYYGDDGYGYDRKHGKWSATVLKLLEQYPWPEYKSLSHDKGVKDIGLSIQQRLILMKAAKGSLPELHIANSNDEYDDPDDY
jgi:hypothetical protein